MNYASLTPAEQNVVLQCLRAAAEGPFFDDEEFGTLFGLSRKEVAAIANRLPCVGEADPDVALAINNTIVNLLGYPHSHGDTLQSRFGVSFEQIERVHSKLRDELNV